MSLFSQIELSHFCGQMNRYKVSCVLSCFIIAHIFKDKHKVVGDINSLNMLVAFCCHVSLPHGAVDRSAVWNRSIPGHAHLLLELLYVSYWGMCNY